MAEIITAFPGILEAAVYGVQIPGSDGRAGMAAIVPKNLAAFDLVAVREHLKAHLPDYARPLFLRLRDHLEITGTFKRRKLDLVENGVILVASKEDERSGTCIPKACDVAGKQHTL